MVSDIELKYIKLSLSVTTEVAFTVGLMTHVFIIAVTVIYWRKGGTMSMPDRVMISILISKMFLQIAIQLELLKSLFCEVGTFFIRFIYFSTMYSFIWLSTLLCVVFCLKISNFRGGFFLRLRRAFSKRIPHFINASFLVSIGQTLVTFLAALTTNTHFASLNSTQTTQPGYLMFGLLIANMLGPLLIFLFPSLLLITSLHLHIKQMRSNREVTSSLDTYYRIIKHTTGSLFVAALSVIISLLAEQYYYMFGFVLFSFHWTTFGTLHSILMIYVTPKLRNPISKILKNLGSNCLTKREEPRDLVAVTT